MDASDGAWSAQLALTRHCVVCGETVEHLGLCSEVCVRAAEAEVRTTRRRLRGGWHLSPERRYALAVRAGQLQAALLGGEPKPGDDAASPPDPATPAA